MKNLKSLNTKIIHNDNGEKFIKVLSTNEFIYFIHSEIVDANPMMFRKSDLSLASDNNFANDNLIEDIENGKAVWIAKSFQENVNCILEEIHSDNCQCLGCV